VHLVRDARPRPRGRAPLRAIVVGVGNAFRRDDGAGLAIAGQLEGHPGVEVVSCEQEPSRLLEAWAGADLALVVDAVSSGAEPGTVHRFDATRRAVPAAVFRGSTHAFGVGDAVELARALGRLPGRLLLYGVEGEDFAAGEGLSPAVAAAVGPLAEELLREARGPGTGSARRDADYR
jgi:hydrogenase maturation protease